MPFPTAHPAAVLPLRRYCPRSLSFLGLVIGSLIPDSSYAFHSGRLADFAHSFAGSFCYDLPVGLAMVYAFLLLRTPLANKLPPRYRKVFLPLCQRERSPWFQIAISLLIGTWTHLFLDALTHRHGWFVLHLPVLSVPLAWIGKHAIRISSLLWNAWTWFGNALVAFAYLGWLEKATCSKNFATWQNRLVYASGFALLSMPCALLHELLPGRLAIYPVAGSLLIIVFFLWVTLAISTQTLRPKRILQGPSRQTKSAQEPVRATNSFKWRTLRRS